jgi:hypothetical protein
MKKIKCKKCQDTGTVFIEKIYLYIYKGKKEKVRNMGYYDVCKCKKK